MSGKREDESTRERRRRRGEWGEGCRTTTWEDDRRRDRDYDDTSRRDKASRRDSRRPEQSRHAQHECRRSLSSSYRSRHERHVTRSRSPSRYRSYHDDTYSKRHHSSRSSRSPHNHNRSPSSRHGSSAYVPPPPPTTTAQDNDEDNDTIHYHGPPRQSFHSHHIKTHRDVATGAVLIPSTAQPPPPPLATQTTHHNPSTDPTSYNDEVLETEEERRIRWNKRWHDYSAHDESEPPRPNFDNCSFTKRRVLQIEYWDRNPETKYQKEMHVSLLDSNPDMSREDWILGTTLRDCHVALEPNLFPYDTPPGVKHYTLWSRTYLTTSEVEVVVNTWLDQCHPEITAWSFDPSNLSEGMSIDLYHVHVFMYSASHAQVTLLPEGMSHRVDVPPSPVIQPVVVMKDDHGMKGDDGGNKLS